DDWARRLPLLVDALAEVDPDLLALQEVCRAPDDSEDALPALLDALAARTGRVYAHHRRETHLAWDTWQEGVALVSAFDVLDRADAGLPAERLPRAAVALRVQTPLGPAVAAVTHLAAEADQAAQRVQQAEAAVAVLDGLAQPGDLRVLMGDFNEVPGGDAVAATLAAGFTDAWSAVQGAAPGPTFPSDAPARRIDYVFVDAPAEVLEAERFLDVEVDGVRPSDHLGVRAGLR
ncbi:MAG: endonuclease/exonuclease/phosphatase family protein, partial [Myxococcales bacterium]|nr:endonuclease/exonuclease/phosphatase family protein [Myxococcales bacterium]